MDKEAKPCLISCGILRGEIEKLVGEGSLNVNPYFLDVFLHNNYSLLEQELKQVIEKSLINCPEGVIVLYGDLCLGSNNKMRDLTDSYGLVKVDALNCIDCVLGGNGRYLEFDPNQEYFFLTPGWIEVLTRLKETRFKGTKTKAKYQAMAKKMFSVLKGIVVLDTLGDIYKHKGEMEEFSNYIGLPILEKKLLGSKILRK